jgi:Carboxypeptidase regulatory-like domain
MLKSLKLVTLWFILCLLASICLAKQFEDGSIEGIVTDESGPVVGASLEARNRVHGDTARTYSDARGHFKLCDLRAGLYSLWGQAEGHDSVWIQSVIVEHGQAVRQDVRLRKVSPGLNWPNVPSITLYSARHSQPGRCAFEGGRFGSRRWDDPMQW